MRFVTVSGETETETNSVDRKNNRNTRTPITRPKLGGCRSVLASPLGKSLSVSLSSLFVFLRAPVRPTWNSCLSSDKSRWSCYGLSDVFLGALTLSPTSASRQSCSDGEIHVRVSRDARPRRWGAERALWPLRASAGRRAPTAQRAACRVRRAGHPKNARARLRPLRFAPASNVPISKGLLP